MPLDALALFTTPQETLSTTIRTRASRRSCAYVNFSAILINVAMRAAERAQKGDVYAIHAVYTTIVFAAMAIEALLNEQAYIQVHDRRTRSAEVYAAVENGASGFERVQAALLYLFEDSLVDGENPANELKLIIQLRNGLTHYRFERPPKKALRELAQRRLFDEAWEANPFMSWPAFATPPLAIWAYEAACHTAMRIAAIVERAGEPSEAELIRMNFDVSRLRDVLGAADESHAPESRDS